MKLVLFLLGAAPIVWAAPSHDPAYARKYRELYTLNQEYYQDQEGNRKTGWTQFADTKLVSIAGIQTWWENLVTVAGRAETNAAD
ncbi:hypothetical protein GQ53DRAFT_847213 [Thozetella sp. PMI_491]|nr:hypothetical protein GQ53DRAFT_847213 [Thozetella sp. PMI_491]